MDHDAQLSRIRKLLAQAEDAAVTPAEAEAFTAKAAELMATYGIDRAMLADADPTTDMIGDRVVVLDPPYAKDKGQLLYSVAEPLRCRTVLRTKYPAGAKQTSMHLFGYRSDLDRVDILYTSLLVQSANALAVTSIPPWENTAAFRRSWLAGFCMAIHRRLSDAERRAAEQHTESTSTGHSVALVLADRSTLVDRARADEYPRLRAGRARSLSGSGRSSGYAAGQRADLGTTNNRVTRSAMGALGR